MIKWFLRLLLIGVVGIFGVGMFDIYEKGYFNIPDLPEGSYIFSKGNGMRGIVLDAEVSDPTESMPKFFRQIGIANPDRRYIAIPVDVAPWFEDAWSICKSPSADERAGFERSMPEELRRNLANARFDAVCRIDVDGKDVLRGLLYSVPKL